MQNIIMIGADQGIGYHMAHQFLEDGNRVAVLDIKSDQISKLQTIYKDTLFVAYADAADENSLKVAIQAAIKRFGVPNIAIHNACICTFKSEPDTDYEVYQQVMNINYFGALRLAKLVLPEMRKAGEGKIIFTSSGVGVTGFGNISPYASSKGAIEALAKCLDIENEAFGITFHIMHPPLTDTASSEGLPVPKEFKADAEKVGRGLAKNINSKKFVICHSFIQTLQMSLCYRHPLRMGKMMWKMAQRAK